MQITAANLINQLENALNKKENSELRTSLHELNITHLNSQQFEEILALLQPTT